MKRYLMGLAVAAGLTIGTASESKAQVVVSLGNPYNGGGFYLNTGVPPVGYYNSYYGAAPVAPYVAAGALGYGYAPGPVYVGPRFHGGYAPRVYAPAYGVYRGRHRRFYGW